MKKIVGLLLLILSICVFGASKTDFRPYLKGNAANKQAKKIVFAAQMEDTKKVVTIYKDGKKFIYTFGLEGRKPEMRLDGIPGQNLFFEYEEEGIQKKFLVFMNANYRYIICYFNNDGRTESYSLEAYKGTNYNPLYMRQLNNKTVYDEMFSYSSADDRLFIRKIKGVGYEKIKFCYICISNVYKYICKNKCRKRSKKNKRRICKN